MCLTSFIPNCEVTTDHVCLKDWHAAGTRFKNYMLELSQYGLTLFHDHLCPCAIRLKLLERQRICLTHLSPQSLKHLIPWNEAFHNCLNWLSRWGKKKNSILYKESVNWSVTFEHKQNFVPTTASLINMKCVSKSNDNKKHKNDSLATPTRLSKSKVTVLPHLAPPNITAVWQVTTFDIKS